MALTTERKGQIAEAILRYRIKKNRFAIGPSLPHELSNMATETSIPLDELKEFTGELAADLPQKKSP